MISGIQHFVFCKRQWALIYIEEIWKDNFKTFKGNEFHSRVNDPYFFEKRGNVIISRSIPLISHELFLTGFSDCVEFHMRDDDFGAKVSGRDGTYDLIPIEYKVGDVKNDISDISQLCAQALCLEEMLNIKIQKGYIYYGKSRRRFEVCFTEELLESVRKIIKEMRYYFEMRITPKPSYTKSCKSCSLYDLCMPRLSQKYKSVRDYIGLHVEE